MKYLHDIEGLLNSYDRDKAARTEIEKASSRLYWALLNNKQLLIPSLEMIQYKGSKEGQIMPIKKLVRALRTLNPQL